MVDWTVHVGLDPSVLRTLALKAFGKVIKLPTPSGQGMASVRPPTGWKIFRRLERRNDQTAGILSDDMSVYDALHVQLKN